MIELCECSIHLDAKLVKKDGVVNLMVKVFLSDLFLYFLIISLRMPVQLHTAVIECQTQQQINQRFC